MSVKKKEEISVEVPMVRRASTEESWLQKNWRPILMLSFGSIVFNSYVLAPYINLLFSVDVPVLTLSERMWDLLALGIGINVTGRSVEKVVKTLTERRSGKRA